MASYNALEKSNTVQHTTSASLDDIAIRPGFYPSDYFRRRPQDMLPIRFVDIITACRISYLKVGVIRNVIDMMTDLSCEGLNIVHPDKKIEAFFRVWSKKVNLKNVVDEFVRHLLIDGNSVIKRNTAKLTKPVEQQWTEKETMAVDTKVYKNPKAASREIPISYNCLNVGLLIWLPHDAEGKKQLAFRTTSKILDAARNPNDPFKLMLLQNVPADIRSIVGDNTDSGVIKLDMEKLYVGYSKKDSWQDWAPPFLYCVLSDLQFKDKIRQAELSAMDGWINVIRLWKLGDHKEKILPAEGAIEKLVNILESNTGGGAIDIVWDSMIDMKEFYPPVDKMWGEEKYLQVNKDILIGLGVPEVLLGGAGANFSNSWIQLKTIMERLKYIRERVTEFLNPEFELICQAMNFDTVPKARFNHMNLEDENVARKLIVDLLDRGVVSVEAVHNVYGEDFMLEVERIKSEKDEFKKAGIEVLSPIKQVPPTSINIGGKSKKAKAPGIGGGRPNKSIDTQRKVKKPKPRMALALLGNDAIDYIEENVLPAYMADMNVSNARKLTNKQRDILNDARLIALSCINPNDDLANLNLLERLENPNYSVVAYIKNEVAQYTADKQSTPTLNQRKRLEALAWSNFHYGDNDAEI